MRSLRLIAAIALVSLSASTRSQAEPYQFVFGSPSYTAGPGGTVAVSVYLQGTGSGATTLQTDGLYSVGVRVFWDGGIPVQPASVLSTNDIIPNATVFDDNSSDGQQKFLNDPGNPKSAGLYESAANSNYGAGGTLASDGSYRILLATFDFTLGSIPADQTVLRFTLLRGGGDTLTGAGTELDGSGDGTTPNMIDTSATTVIKVSSPTVVPEPSTCILVVMGFASIATFQTRRRTR